MPPRDIKLSHISNDRFDATADGGDRSEEIWQESLTLPVCVKVWTNARAKFPNSLWLYQGFAYKAPLDLSPDDVLVLIKAWHLARERRLVRLKRTVDLFTLPTQAEQRSSIPVPVQREVWNRDGGRCVQCGGNVELEYDHIVPLSKGGSNTAKNIQLLCAQCNRAKGSEIGD
jgi:hypothetical protein